MKKICISFFTFLSLILMSGTCPKINNTETGWAGFEHMMTVSTYTLLVEKIETKSDKVIFKVIRDYKENYYHDQLTILDGVPSYTTNQTIEKLRSGDKWLLNIISNDKTQTEFYLSICWEDAINVSYEFTTAVVNSNNPDDLKKWSINELEKELNIRIIKKDNNLYFGLILLFVVLFIIGKRYFYRK